MTPMFVQFNALKAQHPDAILFFRMGDFYETFYGDAEVAAEVLELTLTARNKQNDTPIPMAGVPHHAAAGYIQRLVDAGYRVAIAEQTEDPATAKGLVRREVVRVVTPGVVLDPTALAAHSSNYLMAIHRSRDGWGLAVLDVSTGDFRLTSVGSVDEAVGEVHRMEPREALLGPGAADDALVAALAANKAMISTIEDDVFDLEEASRSLREALGVATLAGFGVRRGEPGIAAAGAVLAYARRRLGGQVANVHRLATWRSSGFMVLDATTRRNLEITKTLIGATRKGSLLGLLDRTGTAMGSRMLREWLAFPLLDPPAIERRQVALQALIDDPDLRVELVRSLKQVADIERIRARVAQRTAHARDLSALRASLLAVPEVLARAAGVRDLAAHVPTDVCAELADELDRWIVDDPPVSLTEGGLLRRGMHDELDELIGLSVDGRSIIAELERRERELTGIPSLKIRQNKVFGYYLEITRAHIHKAPDRYVRKQTLTNGERYITPELKELEEKVLGADEKRKRLEHGLFSELRERVDARGAQLAELARALAQLDVLANLAARAVRFGWTRPSVTEGEHLRITKGRHPVVEAMLDDDSFVPNDVTLDARTRRLVVLTGPNMSGKSTIMRQVALIVLLAQIGSYVPAEAAEIGACDRIFTRVGAADDLAAGQSTFMVEMSETASILHHATARSLVILDEIGRGTSTYDGLSIAWAVAEDLVDRVGCRGLFATHYHELCELAETRPTVVNQSVAVSEYGEKILFLRELRDGGASRSYGIQCARLAGLPRPVVKRAKQLLKHFEKHAPRNERDQLSLFGAQPLQTEAEPEVVVDPLRELLASIDPDALSPREAQALLYRLHELR